jgi:hypothetical protein
LRAGVVPGRLRSISPAATVPERYGPALTLFAAGRIRKQRVNAVAMTRRLVLTQEAAGHPFRRSLPPPAVEAGRSDDSDWKLFLLSFGAFFTCFYTFLL